MTHVLHRAFARERHPNSVLGGTRHCNALCDCPIYKRTKRVSWWGEQNLVRGAVALLMSPGLGVALLLSPGLCVALLIVLNVGVALLAASAQGKHSTACRSQESVSLSIALLQCLPFKSF